MVRKKRDTVGEVLSTPSGEVLSTPSPNLSKRRDIIGQHLTRWNILVSRLVHINLTEEQDEFKWELDSTGVFTVKTHYRGLIN